MAEKPTYEELEQKIQELEKAESVSKKAEATLWASEFLFSQMFEQSTTSTCFYNPEGTIVRVNQTFCKMFGVEKNTILNSGYNVFNDQTAIYSGIIPLLRDIFDEKKTKNWEFNFDVDVASDSTGTPTSKTGKIFLEVFGYPVLNQEGNLEYVVLQHYDITERKKAEESLRERERYLSVILETTQDSFWVLDERGQVIDVNDTYCRISGYSKTELLHMSIPDLEVDETPDETFTRIKRIIENGSELFETRHRKKDGSVFDVEISVSFLGNGISRFFCFCRDITQRKRTEAALLESKIQKSAILNGITTNIALVDKNLNILWANKAAAASVNKLPEEMVGRTCHFFWADPNKPCNQCPTIKAFQTKKSEQTIMHTPDGRFWEERGEPVFDTEGNVVAVVEIAYDITERKHAEEMLQKSEKKLKSILDNTTTIIYIKDQEGRFTLINREFERYFNVTKEEVIGKTDYDLMPKELADRYMENDQKVLKLKEPLKMEEFALLEDGMHTAISIKVPMYDEDGIIFGICGISTDITERKRAENALQESEERFRTLFETVPTAIQGYSPDGTIHYWNKACEKVYGYTKDEAIGKNLIDLIIPPEMRAFVSEAIEQGAKTGEVPPPEELFLMRKDGSRVPVFSSHTLLKLKEKETELYCLDVDMTIQNKLQSQLHQAHKMESIGILAGGLAHDFNNLLYVVLGNIGLAEDNLRNGNMVTENLKEAEKACIKAKELSARLITFSKGGNPVKKMMSINDLLKDTVISALSGSNITQKICIADDIRQVNIDENQIKQVIRNIVVNAREAMDDKGQLTVSCENVDIVEKDYHTLSQGEYIKISFKDKGCGILKENLEKIFDPYFSTKDMGADKGQGLGLTVSYSIIQKHGGLITVESEPQTGSTFSVYLPAFLVKKPDLQKSEEKPAAQEPEKKPAKGTGKILLMDDEKAIRKFLGKVINRLGYDVETCIEGKEAVEIYKKAMESKEPFDVVILDLTNKIGMGGQETMKRLLEIDNDVKGLIITGYSDDPVVANFRAYGFSGFIIKPATKDELSKVIKEVLSKDQ
jgi:PAS domain S-box-containing protein